jgi:hypothetical protein
MTARPSRNLALPVIAFVLAALVAGGSVYLLTPPSAQNSTLTLLDSLVFSSVSNGIQLSALVQPESQAYNAGNFTVIATVHNILPTSVNLNASELVDPLFGPCPFDTATGLELFMGHYNSSTISEAAPLQLYNPNENDAYCPTEETQQYTLGPGGNVTETLVIPGYWTGSSQNATFVRGLPPEGYTVLVFDAWNQTVIGYIQSDYPAP